MDKKFLAAFHALLDKKGETDAAKMIGVSQATINRWKNRVASPRGLSLRAALFVLKQEGLL